MRPNDVTMLILILLLTSNCLMGATFARITDEEKLIRELFADYNPAARPVIKANKPVQIDIQYSLLQIKELDSRLQILTTIGHLVLTWHDERLVWNVSGTIPDMLVVTPSEIWTPEFATINGVDRLMDDYSTFTAVVYPDGSVRWEPGHSFNTMCEIDITFYPFDEQECHLIFGAWSYYTTKMNMTTTSVNVNMDSYELNGEWDIMNTASVRNEFWFEANPDQKFSNIQFSVKMRRRCMFYILNVILPGLLTSVTLLTIFFCPPAHKMHIGIVSLLSLRLFLNSVTDTIPQTDHVPILGIYLTSTMAITTLAMIATVFVLNLYNMREKPVPIWAKKIVIFHVARMICMRIPLRNQITCHANSTGHTTVNVEKPRNSARFSTTESTGVHSDSPHSEEGSTAYTDWNRTTTCSGAPQVANNNRVHANNSIIHTDWTRLRPQKSAQQGEATSQISNEHTVQPRGDTQRDNFYPSEHSEDCTFPWTPRGDSHMHSRNIPNDIQHNTHQYLEDGVDETAPLRAKNRIVTNMKRQSPARFSLSLTANIDDKTIPKVNHSKEWVKIANVIDRLFFVSLLICIIVITLVLFQPLLERKFKQS